MRPTDEQLAALDLFLSGESLVVEALAGTGKTSTLRLLAAGTRRRGRYMAFNASIVRDVQGTMSSRCAVATAHSVAFRSKGRRFAHRLEAPRMPGHVSASRLGIGPIIVDVDGTKRRLDAGFLAGHVMRAIGTYCQSADDDPTVGHFSYIDGIDLPENGPDGRPRRTYENNRAVALTLEPFLARAWADLCDPAGFLRYTHSCYMKLWQLSRPRLAVDYLLLDEAQDTAPVLAAVVEAQQAHAQVVLVGDRHQELYQWLGAVNAMAEFDVPNRAVLSQSFRFGPAIADAANGLLAALDAEFLLRGLDSIASTVGELPDGVPADAVLCRTNAGAVGELLVAIRDGLQPHLIGGGAEVLSFCEAARELKETGSTGHRELACFSSWGDVQRYVEEDPLGLELRLLVHLIDEYGAAVIVRALRNMPEEPDADVVVSTVHKAKGRQWGRVRLGEDLAEIGGSDPDLRVLYVAYTRARDWLDDSALYPAELPT